MPDLFGKKQLGRATIGGRFYATPSERIEAGAIYFPDESSLLFGIAEYTVEAGNLGAFATEGTFLFEKPDDWLDYLGRKVFFRPSTGEIVNQDKKGDVLIGFQVLANVPDDKLGVVLTQGENSVVIMVTSTADSGAGSLRQAIADASDGDVILFDSDVFPVGATTAILLSSYIGINKSVSIYGGFNDGNGGYTSGATKRFYVYRDVEGIKTKVYIDDETPATEDETVLFENVCRVALDGQEAVRCIYSMTSVIWWAGIGFINGKEANGGGFFLSGTCQNTLTDCNISDCSATSNGGGVYSTSSAQNTLNGCNISGCNAANGGGVYSTSSAQNTLNGCNISGCSAANGGGVYSTSSAQNTLNGCNISGCSATSNGGGVYSSSTSQNTLTDCVFDSCSATTSGGGIHLIFSSSMILNNAVFDSCSSGSGGGIRQGNTSTLSLTSCKFINCGYYASETSVVTSDTTEFYVLSFASAVLLTITGGVTTAIKATVPTNATVTINDGAALTITDSATISAATFTSEGRGYLAVGAGIDVSAATLTNVVLCAYGAGLESFTIDEDGASWTAQDLTTPILIEEKGDGAVWTTLSDDATGGSYADTFEIGTTLRAFDGVRFFVASLDAYWQVESFVVASNGGGGAGDDSPSWTISDATITPNAEEV